MTLRRTVLITMLAHIIVLSFVWIGFRVPLNRNAVVFVYKGPVAASDQLPSATVGPRVNAQLLSVPSPEASVFTDWIRLRDLDKPKR